MTAPEWLLLMIVACPVAQGSLPINAGTHWMASVYHQQTFPTEAEAVAKKEALLSSYRTRYPACRPLPVLMSLLPARE